MEREEGPLLVSNLVGAATMPSWGVVKVVFDPVTDGVTLPKFMLA
jgi:hypothetical protein